MGSIEHAPSRAAIAWVAVALAAPAALLFACAATPPPPAEPPVVVVPAPPLTSSDERAPPPIGDEPSGGADRRDREGAGSPPEREGAGGPDAPSDPDVHRFSFSGTLTADDDAGVRFSFRTSGDAGLRLRATFGPDGGVFSFGDDTDDADAGAPPRTPKRAP